MLKLNRLMLHFNIEAIISMSHSTVVDTVDIYDVSPLLINSCIIHYHVK